MSGFSAHQVFLWHQLSIIQFSLILPLSIWNRHQMPHLQAQSYKTAATPNTGCKSHIVISAFDRLAINQGSHDPFFGFDNLLEWLTEFREMVYYLIITDIIKEMNNQMKRCVAQDIWEGAQFPCSLKCTTLLALYSSTSPILCIRIFMEASSLRHTGSLTQSITPFPFLEDRWWGRKFQEAFNPSLICMVTSSHPEAI